MTHHFGTISRAFSAPTHHVPVILPVSRNPCVVHADWELVGAWNPVLWPIWGPLQDDDAAIGKPAPAIDKAEYVKGDPIKLGGGKVTSSPTLA